MKLREIDGLVVCRDCGVMRQQGYGDCPVCHPRPALGSALPGGVLSWKLIERPRGPADTLAEPHAVGESECDYPLQVPVRSFARHWSHSSPDVGFV